jgi:hypothetical protein
MENKNNYKIGVMTHWWTQKNYGQILQAYALQMHLRNSDHNAFLIRYDIFKAFKSLKKPLNNKLSKLFVISSWKKVILKWLKRLQVWENIRRKNEDRKHPRFFDDFKNKHLKFSDLVYSSFDELNQNPPDADVLIVGSDQVWRHPSQIQPYFLDFGSVSTKRIAYAASFGRECLTKEEINRCPKLLQKFTFVGVREISGIELCKQLGVNNAVLVPDPTILLGKEEWLKIAEPSNYFKSGSENIFVYMIGYEDNTKIHKTAYFLNQNQNTIFVSSDGYDPKSNAFPTIGEWIDLIYQADFVVTNSFHGTVFCLIFNKNFITMTRDGNSSHMNVRIKSLLDKFDLDNRILNIFDSNEIERIKNSQINWNRINMIMQTFKSEGKQFLSDALK